LPIEIFAVAAALSSPQPQFTAMRRSDNELGVLIASRRHRLDRIRFDCAQVRIIALNPLTDLRDVRR